MKLYIILFVVLTYLAIGSMGNGQGDTDVTDTQIDVTVNGQQAMESKKKKKPCGGRGQECCMGAIGIKNQCKGKLECWERDERGERVVCQSLQYIRRKSGVWSCGGYYQKCCIGKKKECKGKLECRGAAIDSHISKPKCL